MKRIAFINNKGGVSKTASSIAVANILAAEHNKKVLLVDMDPQKNTTSRFSEEGFRDTFERIMEASDGNIEVGQGRSIENVLLNPTIDLKTIIRKTAYDNLDLLPAQLTLSSAEEKLRTDLANGPVQTRLADALLQVDDDYDYAIIDCGPSVALLNINALIASQEVYIPIRSDGDSVIGMAITRALIEKIQRWNSDLEIAGVFFTCYNNRERMSTETYDYLKDYLEDFDFPLLPITIGNSTVVKQASVIQDSLLRLDGRSKITNQYRQLCDYIVAPNKKAFLKNFQKSI